jgi:hypothetical protein
LPLASLNCLGASMTAPPSSFSLAQNSLEPRLTRPLRSSLSSRPSSLRSSCPTMVPLSQVLMSLSHPPMRCVATGHAYAALLMSSEGPQARQIPFLKASHGPSLPLVPPSPRQALRLSLTPRRLTPRRQAPVGTVRQGDAQGKSWCHTATRRRHHHPPHPPPLRPSQRETPP